MHIDIAYDFFSVATDDKDHFENYWFHISLCTKNTCHNTSYRAAIRISLSIYALFEADSYQDHTHAVASIN